MSSSDCYLERFVRAFVYEKTCERVELHFRKDITVRHVTKKGCILLAVFWAKVLQHKDNFPHHRYTYERIVQRVGELLQVRVEDVLFTVHMATGSLSMEGADIYQWFKTVFLTLLQRFDPAVFDELHPLPPPTPKKAPKEPEPEEENYVTEAEKYMTSSDRPARLDLVAELDLEMQNLKYDELVPKLSGITVTELSLWTGTNLDQAIRDYGDGGLQDGFSVVYRLWRSLLNRWFCDKGTRVYIASPLLDSRRLKDICDLFLISRRDANIDTFFVSRKYETVNAKSLINIKQDTIVTYDDKYQPLVDYSVFRKIVFPWQSFGTSFIAGVAQGQAKVMVTSAKFHGKHFTTKHLETVMVLDMPENTFMDKFVRPLTAEKGVTYM